MEQSIGQVTVKPQRDKTVPSLYVPQITENRLPEIRAIWMCETEKSEVLGNKASETHHPIIREGNWENNK